MTSGNGPFAPDEIRAALIESFDDEEHPANGQVGTVDASGSPQLRTVHLRYAPDRETIAFNAHVESAKWTELEADPRLSGCYHDLVRSVQIRWTGSARLLTAAAQGEADRRVVECMWRLVRPELRALYWLDFKGLDPGAELPAGADLDTPVPTLGTVLCRPELWDILEIVLEDYRKDRRTIYRRAKGSWEAETVSPLHGRILREPA